MLKRPTLDLSAGRHPGPEPLFSFSEYEAFALLNGLARLATGLRSFNHAPRPSRSRKGARADPSAMSGQAFRSQAIRSRARPGDIARSDEHTSELQSQSNIVCRLLLEDRPVIRCVPRNGAG